ncbi:MAG: hypothetical protein ACRC13_05905 [Tannerellaceae bacterium]
MRIDKHSNLLENFFSNFMRQAKDPSHFGLFKSSAEDMEHNATLYNTLLKETNNEAATKMLNENRINPKEYLQKSQEKKQPQSEDYKSYDKSRIDWTKFEQIGCKQSINTLYLSHIHYHPKTNKCGKSNRSPLD